MTSAEIKTWAELAAHVKRVKITLTLFEKQAKEFITKTANDETQRAAIQEEIEQTTRILDSVGLRLSLKHLKERPFAK